METRLFFINLRIIVSVYTLRRLLCTTSYFFVILLWYIYFQWVYFFSTQKYLFSTQKKTNPNILVSNLCDLYFKCYMHSKLLHFFFSIALYRAKKRFSSHQSREAYSHNSCGQSNDRSRVFVDENCTQRICTYKRTICESGREKRSFFLLNKKILLYREKKTFLIQCQIVRSRVLDSRSSDHLRPLHYALSLVIIIDNVQKY